MTAVPFTVQIADEVLSDVQQQLERTRWTDEIDGAGWDYGTNLDYLRQLVAYWCEDLDWRAQERRLNRFPQFQATVDGFRLEAPEVRTSPKLLEALKTGARLIAEGKLRVPVAATYPLGAAKEAITHAEKGGKVLFACS